MIYQITIKPTYYFTTAVAPNQQGIKVSFGRTMPFRQFTRSDVRNANRLRQSGTYGRSANIPL